MAAYDRVLAGEGHFAAAVGSAETKILHELLEGPVDVEVRRGRSGGVGTSGLSNQR
jgi:hypothetical protein